MNNARVAGLGLLGTALLSLAGWCAAAQKPATQPVPDVTPTEPDSDGDRDRRRRLRPWREMIGQAAGPGKPVEGGKTSPDGTEEIACDLPAAEKKKNVGGRDGAGLCVFTSIEYAARWQNELKLFNFQQQMRAELGGGYPEKVDKMIAKYGPGTRYLQYEGNDLSILKAAIKTGRMPGVTYNGYDPHYRGSIAHMVSLAHISDKWAAITDNNFPGDSQFVWMSIDEFKRRWMGGRSGWAVVLLSPPPPPVPVN